MHAVLLTTLLLATPLSPGRLALGELPSVAPPRASVGTVALLPRPARGDRLADVPENWAPPAGDPDASDLLSEFSPGVAMAISLVGAILVAVTLVGSG